LQHALATYLAWPLAKAVAVEHAIHAGPHHPCGPHESVLRFARS
jgi:hypothetical protein